MAKYLTGQRLLAMGIDNSFESLDDVQLESICAQASALTDAYCAVPRVPQMHSFRGGTITDEVHDWRYPESPFDLGQRRVYVFHRPLRSVNYLRIYVSNQPLYLEVQPQYLVVNPTSNYMEIISLALTTSGLFNALIVPNVGLLAPVVKVGYEYGYDLSVTADTMIPTDGRTFRATNQFWKASPAPVIYKNDVIQTSGVTIDRTEGTVTFDTAPDVDAVVTADYSHELPTDIMYGTAFLAHYLQTFKEVHEKGLGLINSIKVAEVSLTRTPIAAGEDIETLAPDAARYLAGYKMDGLVVR